MITKLISKLHIDRYFSSKLILFIDLCASVIASVVVLMFAKLIIPASQLDEETVLYFLLSAAAASFVTFYLMKTNHSIIRHSTLRELAKLFIAVLGKEILISLLYLVPSFRNDGFVYILILDLTLSFTFLLLIRIAMVVVYDAIMNKLKVNRHRMQVLIFGINDKSVALVKRLYNSPHYLVVGFIVHGTSMKKQTIDGLKIYYYTNEDSIAYLKKQYGVEAVLFSRECDAREERSAIIKYCTDNNVKVLIAPEIDEVIGGKIMKNSIREVKIEDFHEGNH